VFCASMHIHTYNTIQYNTIQYNIHHIISYHITSHHSWLHIYIFLDIHTSPLLFTPRIGHLSHVSSTHHHRTVVLAGATIVSLSSAARRRVVSDTASPTQLISTPESTATAMCVL
jgi:hypothetical protein